MSPRQGDHVLLAGDPAAADRRCLSEWSTDAVPSAAAAVTHVETGAVDCVVAVHDPPALDGVALLSDLRDRDASVAVVLRGDADDAALATAVSADLGAYVPDDAPAETLRTEVARLLDCDGASDGASTPEAGAREVLERVSDGFFAVDTDFVVQYINEAGAEAIRTTKADLVGDSLWEHFPEALGSAFETEYETAMDEGEPTTFEEYFPPLGAWFEVRAYPSETGLSVYFRDVTERKVHERELETRTRQFESVLENPVSPVMMLHADGSVYHANEAALSAADVSLADVRGEDLWETPWFAGRNGTAVRVRRAVERALDGEHSRFEAPYPVGSERTVDLAVNPVTDESGSVDGVVVAGRDITERVHYEEQVKHQRSQLAAITRVASVVRDVNQALERVDSRAELETFVCERLVDATDYELAWVGHVDHVTRTMTPQAVAGEHTDYLDDVEVGIGEDDAPGPAARAVRDRTMQVVRDIETAETFAPWRDAALERGYRSCASIPITYGDTLYGTLNVYASRPGAFDGSVRPTLRQFDTILGHALTAVDRKQALTTDRRVTLTFQVDGTFLTRAAAAAGDDVRLAGSVEPEDGAFLRYLAVDGDPHAVASLASETNGVEGARVASESPDGLVEMRLSEQPPEQTLAEHGLVVDEFTVADGEGALVVAHPATMRTRTAVETVEGTLSNATLTAQRETTASPRPPGRGPSLVDEELTDRQQTVLETAYYAGYFEWPRESTAEELAEAMDIAGPTFHQHLRAAHQNLLSRLVDAGATTDE